MKLHLTPRLHRPKSPEVYIESAVEVKREKKILVAPSKDNKYAGLRWKHNEPRTRKLNMATKRGSREPVDVNSNSQVDLR